jgi:hypothetical protein
VTDLSPLHRFEQSPAWLEATRVRRSRRTFDEQAVASEALDTLECCCETFRPFDDARAVLVRDPEIDVFRGAVGTYGKVTGSPHLLVIVAGSGPLAQQHAGYVGEAYILEATRLGLDTCWVGGFFDRKRVAALVRLGPDESAVAVSPVGHAVSRSSGTERTMERVAGSHERKPLDTIAKLSDDWPAWARAAVECARIAPSATNRQPWRFRFEGGALVVDKSRGFELPKVTKRLDCGIAMLHAELGALASGQGGSWIECGEGTEVARFIPDSQ